MHVTYAGFTLLEVLIALIVLSIAMTAIFTSISINSRNLNYLLQKTAAEFVAMNALASIQLHMNIISADNPEIDGTEYVFTQVWHWKATLNSSDEFNLPKISVNVNRQNKITSIVHMTGYITQ